MKVVLQTPYPNRIKLDCWPMQGPFYHPTMGAFSPARDLNIYNGGRLMTVDSSNYDAYANAYFIFLTEPLDFTQATQVIHHMPKPPFEGESNPTVRNVSTGTSPSLVSGSASLPLP